LTKGQVDLFYDEFEIGEGNKIPVNLMDSQGALSDPALSNLLNLTNIVLFHVNEQAIDDISILDILFEKLNMIKNHDPNIIIFLLIRDADTTQILERHQIT